MSLDVLKTYLVKLGFGTDEPSLNKFKQDLDKATRFVESSTTGMTKNYVTAAGVIASALASVGIATIGLLNKIAQSDLEYQKFAQRMFMGRDAAKSMTIALDALGESMEDVAWNPELRQRYFALVNQQRGMGTPKDAQAQLRYIRDIRFEFTRLQVEATYGMQHVGYYLFKYMEGPIKSIREGMGKMNDWLTAHMPEWAEKVGKFLATIINIGASAWRFLSNIFDGLMKIWDIMPGWAQAIAVLLALAFAPISPAIKMIGIALLLLEDFFGYLDGKKSSKWLAPIWDTLISAINFIVKGLVTAMVLIDDIFSGKKSSWSDIFKDLQGAWESSGVNGPKNSPAMKNWNNMVGISPSLSGQVNAGNVNNVKIGDVNIKVDNPNATPKQIAESVKTGMRDALGKATARNTREAAGPYR